MEWYVILLIVLTAIVVALVSTVLIRTALFKPKKQADDEIEEIEFDTNGAISSLQSLIRFKTVSFDDPSKEDAAEFEKLVNALPALYPNVYATCELKTFPGRALLFRWKGKGDGNPAVLMAHYDVVSVEEDKWEKPPFEGIIDNGYLWGRGALDTKVTFNGVLFSANDLIGKGFVPENDIYFAFSGGEEINGEGAENIVKYFKEIGITPELVVDEGGAVVENIFPGVTKPCGLIGIAEKGLMNVKYTVQSAGGHASAPKPHSPIVALSNACARIENHPFKSHLTKPVAEMFDTLGRESTFVYRMIFANMWLFGGILDKICIKSGGELNALMRTTVAFTQTEGSKSFNVIPPVASMVSNI
ncbi:MAG: M20/M25/M40 family metallo-hydrolase, partial [Clostridia bacterium]|nr:M20/M25/M40 family metallo-hydrolase [Clostridia bacterium]